MADQGWVHKFALQNDMLAADTVGRQAMQDGYLENDKIAASTITPTKMASNFFLTGIYGIGTYGTAVYG